MANPDPQDVWAQVCADDSAAAASSLGGSVPSGSVTGSPPSQTPEDSGGARRDADEQRGGGTASDSAARETASTSKESSTSGTEEERGGQLAGLTGIPEVDAIADEARKLVGGLADRVQEMRRGSEPRTPTAIEEAVRLFGPVRQRNPQAFDHLTRAAVELVQAYRAAVRSQEQRWSAQGSKRREHIDLDDGE